jgi:hypothetical protein
VNSDPSFRRNSINHPEAIGQAEMNVLILHSDPRKVTDLKSFLAMIFVDYKACEFAVKGMSTSPVPV